MNNSTTKLNRTVTSPAPRAAAGRPWAPCWRRTRAPQASRPRFAQADDAGGPGPVETFKKHEENHDHFHRVGRLVLKLITVINMFSKTCRQFLIWKKRVGLGHTWFNDAWKRRRIFIQSQLWHVFRVQNGAWGYSNKNNTNWLVVDVWQEQPTKTSLVIGVWCGLARKIEWRFKHEIWNSSFLV